MDRERCVRVRCRDGRVEFAANTITTATTGMRQSTTAATTTTTTTPTGILEPEVASHARIRFIIIGGRTVHSSNRSCGAIIIEWIAAAVAARVMTISDRAG